MKSLLFVDDEPRVLQGLQRQLFGRREEWQMHFAESGPKALEFLATTSVDVIITDMRMPGMDGAQLLTEVMRRHPNTVRIVLSGHAEPDAILRLVGPAHQYLSKPCDAEELNAAITRAFALRDLLSNERLKQLATRTCTLPSLPTLYVELTDELMKEEPSLDRIGGIISKDIGMTTKILQLVNSAFFGLPRQMTNPGEAVVYLGMVPVRALVLTLQVFSQFEKGLMKRFAIDALAQHSWQVGVLARRIAEAERAGPKVQDQCFLAGLLHDVGQLILAAGLTEQYFRVYSAAQEKGQPLWEAELAEFGASHAEMGAYLLGLWGLPSPVVEAVGYHHQPARCPSNGFSPTIAIHVANAFAHDAADTHHLRPGNRIDAAYLATLGLEDRLGPWQEQCVQADAQPA